VPALTNSNTVGLSWTDGAGNGGAAVIDYRVSYNEGSGTDFVTLESNIVSLPFSALPLDVGVTYTFKV
jgi:hypothetical protein